MKYGYSSLRAVVLFLITVNIPAVNSLEAALASKSDLLDGIKKQLKGRWISYSGDRCKTKTFSDGKVVIEWSDQLGLRGGSKTCDLALSIRGGIAHFSESNGLVKHTDGRIEKVSEIYTAPFKIADGRFWEATRAIYLGRNGEKPAIAEMHRADEPGQALLLAAREGRLAEVKGLLDAGTPIGFTTKNSYTALAYAAGRGHLGVVKYLLERGADVNRRSRFAKTPVALAVQGGQLEVLEYLVAQGGDLGIELRNGLNLMNEVAFWGQPQLLDYLASKGVPFKHRNGFGWTPLHSAIFRAANGPAERRSSFVEVARWMLKKGADPLITAGNGKSPLSIYRDAFGVAGPLAKEFQGK